YRHGALHLRVANPIGATTLTVEGRGARTESGQTELVSQTVALPADEEVDVVVPVGTLFDAVFSVSHNASDRQDQLYLADGAWGATADPASGVVTAFDTTPEAREPDAAQWTVERGVRVEGETATWATVFRYLTPGGGPVDLTAYDAIALTVSGSGRPVLRLGKASINGWDQFGARLDLTPEARRVVIPFSDLRLSDGTPGFIAEDVRLLTVAFSGQGGASAPFSLTLTDIAFVSAAATSGEAPAAPTEAMEVSPVHPNPTASDAAVTLALAAGADVTVEVVDVLGRVVAVAHDGPLAAGRHRVALPTDGLAAGSYLCRIRSADGQVVRPMVRAR
ncbi:MAG: T9SS type A sorting domain-containing protein, partial [Bacteroidota bacterium]